MKTARYISCQACHKPIGSNREAETGICVSCELNQGSAEGIAEDVEFEVVVGNIGSVYRGTSHEEASRAFDDYEEQSKGGYGRAGNEPVTLLVNGEIDKECIPGSSLDEEDSETYYYVSVRYSEVSGAVTEWQVVDHGEEHSQLGKMGDSMYVVIYNPSSGEEYLRRKLGDEEIMDERKFAEEIADAYGTSIRLSNGYIPNCSGDIRVEFRTDPDSDTHIWSGESFYFADEDRKDVGI